jgi:CelD/BcsL family acetyltransferase involved in cellulose biosynthesis
MAAPLVVRYESIAELQVAAGSWDDLWQRTPDALPTGRVELIAQWLEQFAPLARFTAVAVEQDGQLVAALPLVERRIAGLIRVGSLPRNDWCWAGHLLLDQSADIAEALATLVDEVRRLPWPLLWFDNVPIEQATWQQFLAAVDARGMNHIADERFRIGTVEIVEQLNRDWRAYQESWSGNHRRHMRKALRRADEEGGVELEVRRPESAGEVESLLQEGFDVEHRSWKGREGSSVRASPTMADFYLRQATQLAQWGNLELTFLRHQGKAIAFEYGWSVRGVYFTPKVGFDDDYSRFSPGQLVRYLVLQDAFSRTDRRAVDFLGPLSDATAKWVTRTYPISRLIVATGKIGRGLLWSGRKIVRPLHAVS